jgi:hypothetical protein
MTPEEWGAKFQAKLDVIASGKPFFTSAGFLVSEMAERIFEKGEKTDGQQESYNTTTELWVGDNVGPKAGTNIGKTGKKIKSTYYTSYSSFRSAMGRESNFMNFRLNNELQSDFLASLSEVSANNLELALKREINAQKRKGLEDRFGAIFTPQQSEIDKFVQVVQDEVNLIMSR